MIIKNGTVFCEDQKFHIKDIRIENHTIIELGNNLPMKSEEVIDADGLYVIPGLVDVHSHGAAGYDFSDGNFNELVKILQYEKSMGVTSYCPTSMTLGKETLLKVFASANQAANLRDSSCANIIGINMEGPFLDAKKNGAQDKKYLLDPDADFFRECNKLSGNRIELVTISPNLPNSMKFIDALKSEVNISLGHTSADYKTCFEAFRHGANHVTHLYNAMLPFEHREPGLVGAAFDSPDVFVELICDGIHIVPSVIKATFEMFKGRVVLISDSMRATGLEDGEYTLGGQKVKVKGKLATLEDGTIAGSVTCLFDMMKNAISFGVAPEVAIAAATINPAKSIGNTEYGIISRNKPADLLLLSKNYDLVKVF